MVMTGFIVGPVHMKVGTRWYHEILHVAPIEQDMFLGFAILCHRGKSLSDMAKRTLTFDGEELSLDVGSSSGHMQVARVTVAKPYVIPPKSAVQLPCRLSQEMSVYVMEPVEKLRVLAPRVVRGGGEEPVMCLVNPSDRYQLIKKGVEIARAYQVEAFIEPTPGMCGREEGFEEMEVSQVEVQVAEVSTDRDHQSTMETVNLPDHLQPVYENSKENLSPEECSQLAQLLEQYQDVFARDEFEQTIDVQGAWPVKQQIRHMSACSAGRGSSPLKDAEGWCDQGVYLQVGCCTNAHPKKRWHREMVH